ncbi:uncharacterized protein SOCEGT47_076990 [Sorangium cellulosum]|uniref:FAD-dependent oxidoreductase 2 FAD binding domain-containing protein n=1 Tax=Sorangium cellulosum TaxID=56 RepID=A0A4P2QBN6_SORCE|nr:hypothetical protein [Sorangium cellulosum]AUX27120.1 uncharacterized protein SOCEGT47_076990 [Sorangium cellulosum]
MLFRIDAALQTDAGTAAADDGYGAVIVGTGIAGAIVANEPGRAGKRVLVVAAETGTHRSISGHEPCLASFFAASSNDNRSPFPEDPNARR